MFKALTKTLLLILVFKSAFAQTEVAKAPSQTELDKSETQTVVNNTGFDVTVSLKNQHYWRGGPIGYSPLVTSQISFKTKPGFEIGSWNGFGFDGVFKDVDTYVSFTKKGFTLALWDVYNFTSPESGYADPATFPSEYFDYDASTTRHFLDLSLGYDFKKIPLSFFLATIIFGRDRAVDESVDIVGGKYTGTRSGGNRYSTYAKVGYTLKTSKADFSPYISYGFVLNNVDETSFWGKKAHGFTEIGINVSKVVKITDSYSVPISAGIVTSPMNNTVNGLVAITLF